MKMMDKPDASNTAKKGLGFTAGNSQLRWFYADELREKTLLNELIMKHTMAPLRDPYACSEHVYVTWSKEHPGKKFELDFDYLGRRAAAVEPCRTKLRGCIMVADIALTLRQKTKSEIKDPAEPPAKVARVEPVIRPPGMPPLMPTYTSATSFRRSVDTGRWKRDGAATTTELSATSTI